MLHELWHYLGTRTASRGAQQLGYAREAAALEVRHRRCRQAWQPHIQATRAALLAAADRLDDKGTALIIGGGVAHDLPLAELLARFQRIILLDIAFTRSTRRLALAWPDRVECCHWDVTGVIDWLAQHRGIPPAEIFETPKLPEFGFVPNWVASVNCLTQLPLLPVDWLYRQSADERRLEEFARALIRAHLDWLNAWQAPWCLISEMDDSRHDANGDVVDSTDYRPLVAKLLEPACLKAFWTWCLHPPGELANGADEIRNVEVWECASVKVVES